MLANLSGKFKNINYSPIILFKREMKNKKSLTRRKASKIGCFDPSAYQYAPSPNPSDSFDDNNNLKNEKVTYKSGVPIVAICGRPNVGKSSLFNRLLGESKSLVTPIPGTTRDRIYGIVEWQDREFILVDTGGMLGDSDEWSSDIHQQAQVALGQADIILFVVDVNATINRKETELARTIRKLEKPVLLVTNKVDNPSKTNKSEEFIRLGLGQPIAASAIHALGEITMLEEITDLIAKLGYGKKSEIVEKKSKEIRVAIVGKPNVGKSSFLNRVTGEDRSVVSNIPGTTTDPVDEHITWRYEGEEVPLTLIDTAGMKKKNVQEKDSLEHLSALWALKVITRAHVCLLLLDAKEGLCAQDKRIASFVVENMSSCLIIYNKWDIVEEAQKGIEKESYIEASKLHLPELKYCPVLFTSAKTGLGVNGVINKAIVVAQNRRKKIKTQKILRILEVATLMKPPPSKRNKRMKIKFASQADTGAPTITLHVNDPELATDDYTRFLTGRFRNEINTLEGSPLNIVYKKTVESANYATKKASRPAWKPKEKMSKNNKKSRKAFVNKVTKKVSITLPKKKKVDHKKNLKNHSNTKMY